MPVSPRPWRRISVVCRVQPEGVGRSSSSSSHASTTSGRSATAAQDPTARAYRCAALELALDLAEDVELLVEARRVAPGAAVHEVACVVAGEERVVAGAAEELAVGAALRDERVVSGAAVHPAAVPAHELVVAVRAHEDVVAAAPHERVVAAAAADHVVS